MPFFARSPNSLPWGDGFELDGWRDFASTTSWELCSTDEFLRVFPRLIPSCNSVPICIVAHLEECLAVLTWRMSRRGTTTQPIKEGSATPQESNISGQLREPYWFPDAPAWMRIFVSRTEPSIAGEREAEAALYIDRLLAELRTGTLPPFREDGSARFAYWTGVHPVYLWPEALVSHELFTAIGWLGYSIRGRGAMLPRDIAEYFCQVLVRDGSGTYCTDDEILASYIRSPEMAKALHNFANRRLAGYQSICHLQPFDRSNDGVLSTQKCQRFDMV
jgi:hypothetical protein